MVVAPMRGRGLARMNLDVKWCPTTLRFRIAFTCNAFKIGFTQFHVHTLQNAMYKVTFLFILLYLHATVPERGLGGLTLSHKTRCIR